MTSIEWLMQTLEQNNLIDLEVIDSNTYYTIIEQAKLLHKQEIIDAANKLLYHGPGPGNTAAEQYYQETFVSKGVREEALQFLTTQAQELDLGYETELPQQEISDEEILKQGNYLCPNISDVFRKDTSEMGAKWYREQLTQRQ